MHLEQVDFKWSHRSEMETQAKMLMGEAVSLRGLLHYYYLFFALTLCFRRAWWTWSDSRAVSWFKALIRLHSFYLPSY